MTEYEGKGVRLARAGSRRASQRLTMVDKRCYARRAEGSELGFPRTLSVDGRRSVSLPLRGAKSNVLPGVVLDWVARQATRQAETQ